MGSETGTGEKAVFFILGAFVGAATALLLAPKSGEETRKYLAAKAREKAEQISAQGRELAEKASGLVEKGKEYLDQQKGQLSAALEAGKQAYREEKEKAKV
ncbi:MAG: YtxH domain-containing protein [Acidobacteria bacterium]|nr:YtxH domain-containing protein [Acidobacteriota bacterium]